MDATVELVGTGGVEWSNGHTLTGSVELQVADGGCARFYSWFRDAIHPGAIANNMCDWNIIDEVEAAALADRDRRLSEGCLTHVDTRARAARAAPGTAARRCGQDSEQAQCYEDCYELFHGVCFSYYLTFMLMGCVDLFSTQERCVVSFFHH